MTDSRFPPKVMNAPEGSTVVAGGHPFIATERPRRDNPIVSDEGFADRGDIFFAAVETTRMPMVVTDPNQPDNPIVFVNEAFLGLSGYPSEEIVGHNCRFLQGPETDAETVRQVREAIAERRNVAVEILNYRKDGSAFWNALFISPIYGPDGRLLYFFASQLDVSRRRDAEDALRQAQKMEAVGQLTGGIAHDFNNLLLVIMGSLDQADTDDAALRRKRLDRARAGAGRAQELTSQLLAFARKQRLEGRPTNLNLLIQNLRQLLGRTLGSNIRIATDYDPMLTTTRVDPVQVEVALLNILINARDAMPEGGDVIIRTCNRTVEPAAGEVIEPGDYVVLSVSDTGEGIAPEILGRIMEPFFTTKDVGKGTGMGLAMVYGFMRQSHGFVRIESKVGKGTTVSLYFPAEVAGTRQETRPAPSPRATARGGRETILLVEDNPDVLEMGEDTLRDMGYDVVTATHGEPALELLRSDRAIDLLFTDIVMPGGINGVMLAKAARRLRPELIVLLTTGWADKALDDDPDRDGFDIIAKPYRPDDLVRKVRTLLDGPDGVS